MAEVSVRDLRNHGGDVLDRVSAGESLTVTRGGQPVAELRPIPRQAVPADLLWARWHRLPAVDATAFRHDVDAVLDARL